MKQGNIIALGLLGFLAFKVQGLFGKPKPNGDNNEPETKGGSSNKNKNNKSGAVKTGSLSNCGTFKWTSDMVNFAKKNPQIKEMVIEFQKNANKVNQLKIMRGYTKNFRISQDGYFGACTQEAGLMAFPKNWFYENQIKDVFDITDKIQFVNAMLKGKSTTYIYNNLILPNKL